MDNRDDLFYPESVNEQVEQLVRIQDLQQQSVTPGALTIVALQSIYQEDEALLARAWERIQQEQQVSDAGFIQEGRIGALIPPHAEIERTSHMQGIQPESARQPRPGQIGRILVAAALLIVIFGSTVLVYSHIHSQTGAGTAGAQIIANADPTANVNLTATVIANQQEDGLAPNATGNPIVSNGKSSFNWPVGQSTYWANLRYHQLTGYWLPWYGDADQWVTGAREAGWNVSQTPHVPSIAILMPYVQGASGYGHVAVVEGINTNGTVRTSNMNWSTNGGGWNIVSYANFTVGAGVYFVWAS